MAETAARERMKLYWAVAATFAASGFLILLTIAALTGSLVPGFAYAVVLTAITLFAAFYLMDIIWEGKGVLFFTFLTMIAVLIMFFNMIFGRQASPLP